nr:MAG TPA: hypothetical protein [Caudoviricetes sp.]
MLGGLPPYYQQAAKELYPFLLIFLLFSYCKDSYYIYNVNSSIY